MDAAAHLAGFIERYSPAIATDANAMLARLRARVPGATLLVYDNYNALAIGFAGGDKAGDIVLSLALYPRWITLFFMRGTDLADPQGLLAGTGTTVRQIRLDGPETLDDLRVAALIAAALALAQPPIDPAAPGGVVIKSISAKQRPRRPA